MHGPDRAAIDLDDGRVVEVAYDSTSGWFHVADRATGRQAMLEQSWIATVMERQPNDEASAAHQAAVAFAYWLDCHFTPMSQALTNRSLVGPIALTRTVRAQPADLAQLNNLESLGLQLSATAIVHEGTAALFDTAGDFLALVATDQLLAFQEVRRRRSE